MADLPVFKVNMTDARSLVPSASDHYLQMEPGGHRPEDGDGKHSNEHSAHAPTLICRRAYNTCCTPSKGGWWGAVAGGWGVAAAAAVAVHVDLGSQD